MTMLTDSLLAHAGANITQARLSLSAPRLAYHFQRHGSEFDAASSQGYLEAMYRHLQRDALRVFTWIRASGQVPFWVLAAPDAGSSVVYNERRAQL